MAHWTMRLWAVVFVSAAMFAPTVVSSASADVRFVNCDTGRKISTALRLPAGRVLIINVRGTCTENLVIDRDNVTIQKDPLAPASPVLNALNSGEPTIQIDGARNVKIKDLTVNGGVGAVVGTNGAVFSVTGTATVPPLSCTIQGGTRYGVVASYSSTATVDGCLVQNVLVHPTLGGGDGVLAAHNASLILTNSTVQGNAGNGLVAVRGGYLRVGQDRSGSNVAMPVIVNGNHAGGIVATENASINIVGGSVSGNDRTGIFIGRGSGGAVGAGVSGLFGPVAVQSNGGDGITVEGGNATILGGPIGGATGGQTPAGNGRAGIRVTNGGSARIGIKNDNSEYVPTEISNNNSVGIHVSVGGTAYIGGTTVAKNGRTFQNPFGQAGISVVQGQVTLVGGNLVYDSPASGIFVSRSGSALIGDGAFGRPTDNTIRDNGAGDGTNTPSNRAGVFVFEGGTVEIRGAMITHNTGGGIQATLGGIVDIRAGTVIENSVSATGGAYRIDHPTFDGGHGVVVDLQSTVRLRDAGTVVQGNAGDGIHVFNGGAVHLRNPPSGDTNELVSVTNNFGLGVQCFQGQFLSGRADHVTGNDTGQGVGAQINCMGFPPLTP